MPEQMQPADGGGSLLPAGGVSENHVSENH